MSLFVAVTVLAKKRGSMPLNVNFEPSIRGLKRELSVKYVSYM